MNWEPHVTVATVIHSDGRFLCVHEHTDAGTAYNQPAGHIEPGETPEQAAIRETLEETGYQAQLIGFLGTSQYLAPSNGLTYFRFTYIAQLTSVEPRPTLDDGIIEAVWLSKEELQNKPLRSPLVLADIERYLAGVNLPLETHQCFL